MELLAGAHEKARSPRDVRRRPRSERSHGSRRPCVCRRSSRKAPISASRAPGGASAATSSRRPVAGRERRGDLKLRIVAPARPLIGVRPAVVEDIFALAVALEIAGRGGDDAPAAVLDHDMRRRPAGAPADRARGLERVQEGVRDEGIEPLALGLLRRQSRRIGAGVPGGRVDRRRSTGRRGR